MSKISIRSHSIAKIIIVSLLWIALCKNSFGRHPEADTLLRKEKVTLLLDNGSIFQFKVSGDIYLTNDFFVFHPKVYRKRKHDRYNHLVKELVIPLDSIVKVRKGSILGVLLIKTRNHPYGFSLASTWKEAKTKKLHATIDLINKARDEN